MLYHVRRSPTPTDARTATNVDAKSSLSGTGTTPTHGPCWPFRLRGTTGRRRETRLRRERVCHKPGPAGRSSNHEGRDRCRVDGGRTHAKRSETLVVHSPWSG